MKFWLASLLIGAVISIATSSDLSAQGSRPGVGERERGILNRLGARRDDRRDDRRNLPTPAPANTQANNAQANNARGPATPRNNSTAPVNAAGVRSPVAGNSYVPLAGANQAGANQAGTAVVAAGYSGNTPGAAPGALAGSLPPNRLPYSGPGVVIRLPERLRGEVNYLLNENEHLILGSGEVHHLALADRYEVRFSRGVTSDGRSYGEARYAVSEGVYRFDVSDNGWELYREGEASEVRGIVQHAQQRAAALVGGDSVPLSPGEPAISRPGLSQASAPVPSVGRDEILPSPAPSAGASEDSLPVPRSILEPGF